MDTENSADDQSQSVRRKGGKYVYIICSKNPKHKQRYDNHTFGEARTAANISQTRLIERREERLHCTTTGIPFSAYLVLAFQMDHHDFFPPHLDLYTVPCYAVTTENTHDNASDIVHQCSRSVVYLSLL